MNLSFDPPPVGAPYTVCAHHDHHETMQIHRILDGQPIIQDVPPITRRLRRDLDLTIYDWRIYSGDGMTGGSFPYDWCTAQDVISYSIHMQGMWEGYETPLVLDILDGSPGVVVDLGCQLGWYSTLAVSGGYETYAVDANAENLRLAGENMERNRTDGAEGHMVYGWIDEHSHVVPLDGTRIRLLKMDVEGAEKDAVRMFALWFAAQTIDYALVEVSPVFNDTYAPLMEWISRCGYDLYKVPGKGWEHTAQYGEQPLETLREYCRLDPATIGETVAGWHQENVLAIAR
jgi:SAM-dependent methyltransferase